MTVIEFIFIVILLIFGIAFAYMSSHVVEEQKRGITIPLPWEQDGFLNKTYHKLFDKNEVKYRDGDNT